MSTFSDLLLGVGFLSFFFLFTCGFFFPIELLRRADGWLFEMGGGGEASGKEGAWWHASGFWEFLQEGQIP